METISRFFDLRRQNVLLLGPRGTGKSTYIRQNFPDALNIDLLLPDVFRNYVARPERLIETVNANKDASAVVIDEIQKIPELLEVVHSLIETRKDLQFILTGSSARKLRRTGVNLLGGRAVVKHVHPFLASELKDEFNLERALEIGMIPLVVASQTPQESLAAYVDLYLREEVQAEGLTRNIGNFSRFLESISFSHAAVLNISNVARDCQIERKLVEAYISILEDLLLAHRIQVFTKRAKRAVSSHPKFFFFDAGVFNTLRPAGPLDSPEERYGAALEGLVFQHLRAWIDYFRPDCSLHFFRTSAGSEIDFVLYGKDVFKAIEVKNSSSINPGDLRTLKDFGKDYKTADKFLLYRGKERLLVDNILVMPVSDFLLTELHN